MHGQVLYYCIFVYFVLEMRIKMMALGILGFEGSYFSNNRSDTVSCIYDNNAVQFKSRF